MLFYKDITCVKHHKTLRSTLGITSAIAAKAKKDGGSGDAGTEEERNPRWLFLIKQKKKDLEYQCKNRKLPFTGTKKVLTRRLVEFDTKQKQLATETRLAQTSITTEVCEDDEEYEHLQGAIDEMENEEDAYVEYFQEYE